MKIEEYVLAIKNLYGLILKSKFTTQSQALVARIYHHPPPFYIIFFYNFLFTYLFSIKFLYFFIILSLFPYLNFFVSIFIQSYANINLDMSTLYISTFIVGSDTRAFDAEV
jgi:hypothetical protein